ncbi:hypothetical protein EI982_06535 [Haloplanus rallus]|uniref:Uncharacterized protein n=1 Tax=Haloplanus rallus TaxID=1816183 RepID=A0A6B9F2B6_9EURY|nr:hypothetical protein [Haloplanus rallus]QGX94466.1 hypothetical protein EI982_06535 [Haloplanus rallus]
MANDSDPETPVSVSTGEVRVGKDFEADRFPVPAIAFEIESLADDPTRIRLVDRIPESFAMEGVGFHPDYDSDNWTAYRDHRVAYERTLEPGESVLTVYGIRIDDPDEAEAFLEEPTVELMDVDTGDAEEDADGDAGSDDVLGRETTQVVRDALSGEGTTDLSAPEDTEEADDSTPEPLLDDEVTPRSTDEEVTPRSTDDEVTPRSTDDDLSAAMRDRDESVDAVDAGSADGSEAEDAEAPDEADDDEPEAVGSADAAAALDPRAGDETPDDDTPEEQPTPATADDGTDATADDGADATADDGTDATADTGPAAAPGSVASALAAEIREGSVDDDDMAVLREAFEGEVPTSVDVRVSRLQSQVEDVLAYRDALADFLDENGTAEEVLGDVSEDLADLHDRVDDLDASLSAAADDRAALREDVTETADAVAETDERLEAVGDDLDRIESRLERLDEGLSAVEDVEDDIEEIRSELADLRSFRDRLSNAFGTGEE